MGAGALKAVLERVEREGQTLERVERCVAWAREFPGLILNVDLMTGLPRQTPQSFLRDLRTVCGWKPEMIHLYQFEPLFIYQVLLGNDHDP